MVGDTKDTEQNFYFIIVLVAMATEKNTPRKYLKIFSSKTTDQILMKLYVQHQCDIGNKWYGMEFWFHHFSACHCHQKYKCSYLLVYRVEVDCRHIFQPGQLGVAIGRARCVEGLRIVIFSLEAVIPQPQCVTEFLSKEGRPFLEDCSCCQTLIDQWVFVHYRLTYEMLHETSHTDRYHWVQERSPCVVDNALDH